MSLSNLPLVKSKVFLVDDDEDDRFLFLNAIQEFKDEFEFEEFADGESLMNYLASGNSAPDAIFLDLNLPRYSGIDCLDFLRVNLGDKVTKVFIISTSSSKSMIESTRQKGANLYIRKSENFMHLKRLINIAFRHLESSQTVPYYLNDLVEG
jgi:CheY-like chemotaxis protein